MKERYPLPILLRKMEISKSSYYYQIKTLKKDKYRMLRVEIIKTFGIHFLADGFDDDIGFDAHVFFS